MLRLITRHIWQLVSFIIYFRCFCLINALRHQGSPWTDAKRKRFSFCWRTGLAPNSSGASSSGSVPKQSNGADCKSAGSRLRRCESFPAHHEPLTSISDVSGFCLPDSSGSWQAITQSLLFRMWVVFVYLTVLIIGHICPLCRISFAHAIIMMPKI